VCLTFSEASLKGFYLGQLSVFVAVMLLAALVFQGQGRPIWAGVCLFLATVKFVTMIPFLLLFLRRADRWTWAVLITSVLGSCALTGRIIESPARMATLAQRAKDLAAPGKVNDYSYEGTRNESIISFEHLFYRLNMRDRGMIRSAQLLALLALLAWVAYLVVMDRLPRSAAACLVSYFSLLFIYHRDYDTVILALPLLHCAERLRATTGGARRFYAACGLIVIAVLYTNAVPLRTLAGDSFAWGTLGYLFRGAVLPYATWLILLGMVLLVRATSADRALAGEKKSFLNESTGVVFPTVGSG
jgi:hypothetical protein